MSFGRLFRAEGISGREKNPLSTLYSEEVTLIKKEPEKHVISQQEQQRRLYESLELRIQMRIDI